MIHFVADPLLSPPLAFCALRVAFVRAASPSCYRTTEALQTLSRQSSTEALHLESGIPYYCTCGRFWPGDAFDQARGHDRSSFLRCVCESISLFHAWPVVILCPVKFPDLAECRTSSATARTKAVRQSEEELCLCEVPFCSYHCVEVPARL